MSKKIEYLLNILVVLGAIYTIYNIHAYNQSFDRCEELLAEIKENSKKLHNEITTLQISIGAVEVDYE